ncbi:MAG TPA: hypothetical protein P5287_01905 [bacterium]|nr:hypothetical protein [bacterium]
MVFDLLVFLFFLIFGVSFFVNLYRAVRKQMQSAAPATPTADADVRDYSGRDERIQRERNELRYGFPTPPPHGDRSRDRHAIRVGAHGSQHAHHPVTQPAAIGSDPHTSPEDPHALYDGNAHAHESRETSPVERLLEGEDPVLQGVLMSVILNKPKALRNDTPAARRFKTW